MKSANILRRHADLASACLSLHTPGKPFTPTLSNFLKANKSFGSRDRKRLRAMCYDWFRLGFSLELSLPNQVLLSYLILDNEPTVLHESIFEQFDLPADWQEISVEDRLGFLSSRFGWTKEHLFPVDFLSNKLDAKVFCQHQLNQPLIWLNVKPVDQEDVINSLENNNIKVSLSEKGRIGVPSTTAIDKILAADQYEIQDLSSQLALDILKDLPYTNVWDACAGSGGKSLSLARLNPSLKVFVSDIRSNILVNLKKRFSNHKLSVSQGNIDLQVAHEGLDFVSESGKNNRIKANYFGLVITDVPCTGSGTWNRNPEHVCTFESIPESILLKQQNILSNSWPFVASGGYLLFLTCSVFGEENEKQIEKFQLNHAVEIVAMDYVIGPDLQSDSMFYCLIKKV